MNNERLKYLAENNPGECSLAEVRQMARELLSCRPYRAMADSVLAACIEARDYDNLYNRCMDAIDTAEPGTRQAIEDEHAMVLGAIVKTDKEQCSDNQR